MTIILIIVFLIAGIFFVYSISKPTSMPATDPNSSADMQEGTLPEPSDPLVPAPADDTVGLSNPASEYCVSNGGMIELVTEPDGSQFGLCYIDDTTACEEWLYMNGECTLEADALLIREALVAKGLDLTNTKVVIKKHLGEYIEGMVIPVSEVAGGGYVFAVKEDGVIKILADGNGTLMCEYFAEYPEFSRYLVPSCYDSVSGEEIQR